MSGFRAPAPTKQKGDRGEALVRLMFEWHGCQVLEFGVEKHFPQLLERAVKLHKKALGTAAIRSLPDFLIMRQTAEGLLPTFIEVKTHKSQPAISNLVKYAEHGAVCVVWVGPTGLQYTWVIKDKEIGPFRPIERLGILEADAELMNPIHDLARLLHEDHAPGEHVRKNTATAEVVKKAPAATDAESSARAKYWAKKKRITR